MPDPRLVAGPKTVNERIQDRVIRHNLFVQRVGAGNVNAAVAFLENEYLPDLRGILRERLKAARLLGRDRGVHTTRRLRSMIKAAEDLLDRSMRDTGKRLTRELVGLAKSETSFEVALLNATTPKGIAAVSPTATAPVLKQIVTGRTIQGTLLDNMFEELSGNVKRALSRQINLGIAASEHPSVILKRITGDGGVLDGMKRDLETVVRSAISTSCD